MKIIFYILILIASFSVVFILNFTSFLSSVNFHTSLFISTSIVFIVLSLLAHHFKLSSSKPFLIVISICALPITILFLYISINFFKTLILDKSTEKNLSTIDSSPVDSKTADPMQIALYWTGIETLPVWSKNPTVELDESKGFKVLTLTFYGTTDQIKDWIASDPVFKDANKFDTSSLRSLYFILPKGEAQMVELNIDHSLNKITIITY